MSDKLPYLPFYINDWETDSRVKCMGPATRTYYMTLLFHQWREGSIPSDRKELRRILLFPLDPMEECPGADGPYGPDYNEKESDHLDFDRMLNQVLECFESDGRGRLSNRRLNTVRSQVDARKSSFSARGKRGRTKQLQALAQAQAGQSESNTYKEEPPLPPFGRANRRSRKPREEYSEAFMKFWQVYPKTSGKFAAFKAFQKVNPQNGDLEHMIESVKKHCGLPQWQKDDGQYIPNAATWLNQRRFDDEFTG